MYRCLHVCVRTEKSPPECTLFKDCLRGITSDSLCTSLCTQSLWCSSSFLHLTLSCLNLLLKWRLSWAAVLLIWQLWVSIQWKLVEKQKKNEEQEQSLSGRTSMHIFINCTKTRWRVLWLCLNYDQSHITMMSWIFWSMLMPCFHCVHLILGSSHEDSFGFNWGQFEISTAETSAAIQIQMRSMIFGLWCIKSPNITFEKLNSNVCFQKQYPCCSD